jgi:CheY-like chemotaxis protein
MSNIPVSLGRSTDRAEPDKQAQTQSMSPRWALWDAREPLEHRTHCHDARGTAIRCLIVDDNDHFLQVVSDLLEREGIEIIGVASTSTEALRQVDEFRPDVTLVDIALGEESGFDLAQQLTATTFTEQTTVILMSASYDEKDIAHMIAAGPAASFLSKIDISGRAIRDVYRQHRN